MKKIRIDVSKAVIKKSIKNCDPRFWVAREYHCPIALATKMGIESVIHRRVSTTVRARGGFTIEVRSRKFRLTLPMIAKEMVRDFDRHMDKSGPIPEPCEFTLEVPDKCWEAITSKIWS